MRTTWAAYLAASGVTDAEVLKLLLEPLEGENSAGKLDEHILPAVAFLERSGGQHVDLVVPALTKKLGALAAGASEEAAQSTPDAYAHMLHGLSSVVASPDTPHGAQAQLSGALYQLLQASLQQVAADEAAARRGAGVTVADAVIRAVMKCGNAPLALLPSDATKLLSWGHTTLLQPYLQKTGSSKGQAWRQESIMQVLVSATQACAPSPYDPTTSTTSPPLAGRAPPPDQPAVLMAVVEWSRQVIQVAMTSFSTGGASSDGDAVLSGTTTRAAARLCLAATLALVTSGGAASSNGVTPSGTPSHRGEDVAAGPSFTPGGTRAASAGSAAAAAMPQVEEVVEEVLGLVEACVMAASDHPRHKAAAQHAEAAERVLLSAMSILEGLGPLMAWAGAQGLPLTSCLPQVKGMLLSVAASMPSGTTNTSPPSSPSNGNAVPDTGDAVTGLGWWAWDVNVPLTSWGTRTGTPGPGGAAAAPPPPPPPPGGEAAGRLLLLLAELLCSGLATAWRNDQQPLLHAMLLPPEPTLAQPSEVKVMALVTGRVYVLLHAEPQLSRSVLPLMVDTLSASAAPASSAAVALRPDVFACVATTLAGMAACAASGNGTQVWAYHQVCDLLVRMYRETCTGRSKAATAGGAAAQPPQPTSTDAHPLDRGPVLASALTHLGLNLNQRTAGGAAVRRDLRYRLLSLFSDLAGMVGGRDTPALGRLLPAVAAACEGQAGLGQEVVKAVGSHVLSSSRLSYADVQKTQHDDITLIKLLRLFWLYVSIHGLAKPSAPNAWRKAAGRVASATPVLLAGLGAGSDMDVIERLKAQFNEPLASAGAAAEPSRLRATLFSTLDLAPGSPGLSAPLEASTQAYLLAVATCELARASLAPLPGPGGVCPISITLAYLQVTRSSSANGPWYARIVEQATSRYLTSCEGLRTSAATELSTPPRPITHNRPNYQPPTASPPAAFSTSMSLIAPTTASTFASFLGGAAAVRSVGSVAEAVEVVGDEAVMDARVRAAVAASGQAASCVEQLAVALILHLTNWEGHTEGSPAQVVQTSQQLLLKLLSRYPTLYWSPACLQALLSMLQLEEGDRPLGTLKSATSSGGASPVVWKVLKAWVFNAAAVAPSRTEALLHQFLGQQSSTPAPYLPPSPVKGDLAASASAAALRRATDLLAVAASARPDSQLAIGTVGERDTTLALCRKQYYSGLVSGLTGQQASQSGTLPGQAALQALRATLRNQAGARAGAALQRQYLCGAAVLALAQPGSAAAGDGEEEVEAEGGGAQALAYDDDLECLRDASNRDLLHCLCAVPLERFTPEVMSLALFAWTWVGASSPLWLLPLASQSMTAWCMSVDRRMGLFSGAWGHEVGKGIEAEVEAEAHEGDEAQGDGDTLLDALLCHQQWLCFFTELWDSVGDRSDADRDTVAVLLQRALHYALTDPSHLSTHPAAVAPRFRLLTLALRVVRQCRATAKEGSGRLVSLMLLQDKLIKAGLQWFSHTPTFSAHLSQQQSEEQVTAVREFAIQLDSLISEAKKAWQPLATTPVYTPTTMGRSLMEATASSSGSPPEPPRSSSHPVWGAAGNLGPSAAKLLLFLAQREVDRLQVWSKPVPEAFSSSNTLPPPSSVPTAKWEEYVDTAWQVSPALAVGLTSRFPGVSVTHKLVVERLLEGCWRADVQALPEAALMLAMSSEVKASSPELWSLAVWAAGDAAAGLQLISSKAGAIPVVKAYAVRCLENTPPEKVTFFLSQLVQCLRDDKDRAISRALMHMAQESDLFAHQLVWALQTEMQPPQEAFNPEVKRSGWQPPKDYGLWKPSDTLLHRVLEGLSPERLAYWEAENNYFEKVTSISGVLKKVVKEERRAGIAVELAKFEVTRPDLYVPTNPNCRVITHDKNSGRPMQSAAKVPILVAFAVDDLPHIIPGSEVVGAHLPAATAGAPAAGTGAGVGAARTSGGHGGAAHAGGMHRSLPPSKQLSPGENGANGEEEEEEEGADGNGRVSGAGRGAQGGRVLGQRRKLACIFKVGDDCRQDVLALQVVHLLKDAFTAAGLPAYLCPYGCLPTGYERGIIEVVPNTSSRAALGEMSDRGLYDIFQAMFGAPGSPAFEAARQNFIASEAGYAIASFLLQAKDRHNGNLLVSNEGHLVHIDFGFILEISPGGNMGFESAAFKLSHEMTQLLDPGGGRSTSTWAQFEELCVRSYLVARTVAEPIIATVALMSSSGLPCFGRGAPVENLRRRFHLEMSERQAAAFMRGVINDAYQKWTTGFYDYIQALQNRIPY